MLQHCAYFASSYCAHPFFRCFVNITLPFESCHAHIRFVMILQSFSGHSVQAVRLEGPLLRAETLGDSRKQP